VLYINGLPLFVIELKNPADEQDDIFQAHRQQQSYKEEFALFQALCSVIQKALSPSDSENKRHRKQAIKQNRLFSLFKI
jgi:type I site-specific restriction-modification system R (restriction) subunit